MERWRVRTVINVRPTRSRGIDRMIGVDLGMIDIICISRCPTHCILWVGRNGKGIPAYGTDWRYFNILLLGYNLRLLLLHANRLNDSDTMMPIESIQNLLRSSKRQDCSFLRKHPRPIPCLSDCGLLILLPMLSYIIRQRIIRIRRTEQCLDREPERICASAIDRSVYHGRRVMRRS